MIQTIDCMKRDAGASGYRLTVLFAKHFLAWSVLCNLYMPAQCRTLQARYCGISHQQQICTHSSPRRCCITGSICLLSPRVSSLHAIETSENTRMNLSVLLHQFTQTTKFAMWSGCHNRHSTSFSLTGSIGAASTMFTEATSRLRLLI